MNNIKADLGKNFIEIIIFFFLIFYRYTKEFFVGNNTIQNLCFIIIFLLFLFYLFTKIKYVKTNEIVLNLLLVIISFIIKNPNFYLLYIIARLFITTNNKKFLLKECLVLSVLLYLILVVLYFILGFNAEFDKGRFVGENLISKKTLGFSGPNPASMCFLTISLLYLLQLDKIRFVNIIFTFILNLLVFSFTNSRASFFIICFLLSILLFDMIFGKKVMIKLPNPVFIYFGMIAITIFLIFKYGNVLDSKLDIFLSRRLSYSYRALKNISLFGNKEDSSLILDNFYVYVVYFLGVIGFILISFIIVYLFRNLPKKRIYVYVFFAILLMLFMETSFVIGNVAIGYIISCCVKKENRSNENRIYNKLYESSSTIIM